MVPFDQVTTKSEIPLYRSFIHTWIPSISISRPYNSAAQALATAAVSRKLWAEMSFKTTHSQLATGLMTLEVTYGTTTELTPTTYIARTKNYYMTAFKLKPVTRLQQSKWPGKKMFKAMQARSPTAFSILTLISGRGLLKLDKKNWEL
jgi:hypothetical protein